MLHLRTWKRLMTQIRSQLATMRIMGSNFSGRETQWKVYEWSWFIASSKIWLIMVSWNEMTLIFYYMQKILIVTVLLLLLVLAQAKNKERARSKRNFDKETESVEKVLMQSIYWLLSVLLSWIVSILVSCMGWFFFCSLCVFPRVLNVAAWVRKNLFPWIQEYWYLLLLWIIQCLKTAWAPPPKVSRVLDKIP